MVSSIGAEVDRVTLNGSGGNEPTGVMNWSGIPVFSLGTNGAAISRANLIEMERLIANSNGDAGADARMAFVTTPNGRAKMRLTDASTGNAGRFLWADDDFAINVPAYATKNLPNNLTKGTGTNLSAAILGNWSALVVNLFSAVDLQLDPFKFVQAGSLRLTAWQEVDVAVTTPESFQVVRDMVTS
jgi:HK97 family phage major capsid protein